jgi:3-oxoacyl-[acyl-carrier protein] reductase
MLLDKLAVVTSGGTALGYAVGQRLGQAGAHVVLADIDEALCARAMTDLQSAGLQVSFGRLDARDPAQSQALVKQLCEHNKALDIWINNPPNVEAEPAESMAPEHWDVGLASCLSSSFYCAQAAGRQMLLQQHGVIINIASVQAYFATEGGSVASVASAGLVMLTQALAVEWARRGVRVVGLALGTIDQDEAAPQNKADFASAQRRRIPMGRPGSLTEVAEAISYLASDAAAYVVGETMRVDGGWAAYQLF